MKRVWLLLLVCVLIATMAGCRENDGEEETIPGEETREEREAAKIEEEAEKEEEKEEEKEVEEPEREEAAPEEEEEAEPEETGTIAGRVVDGHGARVEVVVEGETYEDEADEEGYYRIEGVPVGEHEVTADYRDFEEGTRTAPPLEEEGDEVTVDFELESAIESYRVTFKETNGLSGVEMVIYNEEDLDDDHIQTWATTDETGEGEAELTDDRYWFIAESEGYSDYKGSFVVDGQEKTVEFSLE